MFSRATGFNVLLDEVSVSPALWAGAPRYVSIALTNACELSCAYCYAPKYAAALDAERVIGWLGELDANGCLGIGFGGGEPTIHRQFTELCRYAADNTGLSVAFTTHAHRLDDTLAARLAGKVNFIRVSMDGVGATYQALRGRSFDDLLMRLDTIRALAPFGINFVVNARTFQDLDAATELAAEAGAVEFLLLPEQRTQQGGGIDDATEQAFRHWVSQYSGPIHLCVSEGGADGLPTCGPLEKEYGLRGHVHVNAAGVLQRSSFESDGIVIGDTGIMPALGLLRTFLGEP